MKINWINYFFHTNFSEHAEVLKDIPVGDDLEESHRYVLASILQEMDRGVGKSHWVVGEAEKEWNLSLATVTHNGRNCPNFATNSKYSHVLILQFNEESEGPVGKVYLQYNRVED